MAYVRTSQAHLPRIPWEHFPRFSQDSTARSVAGIKRVFPGICSRFPRATFLVVRDFWVFFRVPPARTYTSILLARDSPGLSQKIPTFSHFSQYSPGVPRGFPRKPPHFHLFSRVPPGVARRFPRKPPHFHLFSWGSPEVPQGIPQKTPTFSPFSPRFSRGSPGIPQEIYCTINQIQKTVQNCAFSFIF